MIINQLTKKIVAPYASALFNLAVEKKIILHITTDLQNLEIFFNKNFEFKNYLNSPIVSKKIKSEVLTKILKPQLNSKTFKFLIILINCKRINLLKPIILNYLELVNKRSLIKTVEISTAFSFTNLQKSMLIRKLKKLTHAHEIKLLITVDSNLIGGFLIKIDSKIIDFTIKNKFQNLAKCLNITFKI